MAQPQLSFGLQANVMDQGCCWLNRFDQIDAFPCPDHRLGWIAGTSIRGTPPDYTGPYPAWNLTTTRYCPNARAYRS